MRKSKQMRLYVGVVVGAVILAVGVLMYMAMQWFSEAPPTPQKVVRQITVLKPPPPPPPPPEIEKPEPEMEEQIEEPEPEPEPEPVPNENDEPPPGEDLGLDAEGVAGDDAFGLKARKGGASILGGSRFAWYAGQVKDMVEDLLLEEEDLRRSEYSALLSIWIDDNGNVLRFDFERGTGDTELDGTIRMVLSSAGRVSERPPADMPQPIKLRIRSRL